MWWRRTVGQVGVVVRPARWPAVLLDTVVGRAKDRCLARDGRVSLLWDDEYESVVVQGRVVERYEGEPAKADISHLATRYGIAPERYAAEERVVYAQHDRFHDPAILTIQPIL